MAFHVSTRASQAQRRATARKSTVCVMRTGCADFLTAQTEADKRNQLWALLSCDRKQQSGFFAEPVISKVSQDNICIICSYIGHIAHSLYEMLYVNLADLQFFICYESLNVRDHLHHQHTVVRKI